MLDLHTHILPGMDDGSKSVEQSISMLRSEWSQGIDSVVLTPHYYAERESPEHFLHRRDASFAKLIEGLEQEDDVPALRAGAEVAFYHGICRTDEIGELCIAGTRFMLLEMPFCRWNARMIDELFELSSFRGIRPILAHVDRYLAFGNEETALKLSESGIFIQANSSFFQYWRTSRKAMQMLWNENIHFIGSDCHNMDTRKPDLGKAVAKIKRKLGREGVGFLEDMENMLFGGAG